MTDEEKQEMWNDAVQGEWWISPDGDAMYADGDSGDYDHEYYVRQEIMHNHGLYEDESDEDMYQQILYTVMGRENANRDFNQPVLPGIDLTEEEQEQEESPKYQMMMMASPQQRQYMEDLFQSGKRILGDETINPNDYALWNFTPEETDIFTGKGDFRRYAMEKWGWKRVINRDVETWTLTGKDLRAIATGLFEGFDMSLNENAQFNIEVGSNGRSYWGVPYWVLDDGKPAALQPYRTGAQGQILSKHIKYWERTSEHHLVDQLYHGTIHEDSHNLWGQMPNPIQMEKQGHHHMVDQWLKTSGSLDDIYQEIHQPPRHGIERKDARQYASQFIEFVKKTFPQMIENAWIVGSPATSTEGKTKDIDVLLKMQGHWNDWGDDIKRDFIETLRCIVDSSTMGEYYDDDDEESGISSLQDLPFDVFLMDESGALVSFDPDYYDFEKSLDDPSSLDFEDPNYPVEDRERFPSIFPAINNNPMTPLPESVIPAGWAFKGIQRPEAEIEIPWKQRSVRQLSKAPEYWVRTDPGRLQRYFEGNEDSALALPRDRRTGVATLWGEGKKRTGVWDINQDEYSERFNRLMHQIKTPKDYYSIRDLEREGQHKIVDRMLKIATRFTAKRIPSPKGFC